MSSGIKIIIKISSSIVISILMISSIAISIGTYTSISISIGTATSIEILTNSIVPNSGRMSKIIVYLVNNKGLIKYYYYSELNDL